MLQDGQLFLTIYYIYFLHSICSSSLYNFRTAESTVSICTSIVQERRTYSCCWGFLIENATSALQKIDVTMRKEDCVEILKQNPNTSARNFKHGFKHIF